MDNRDNFSNIIAFCGKAALVLLALMLLNGCEKTPAPQPLLIAINPWPGYEMLYLAKTRGYFKEQGLDVELKEVSSLADAQRAFLNGQVDGFASTLVESVQAHLVLGGGVQIVMIPDFSNGGDAIIARREIESLSQLKGKRLGGEMSSLGLMIAQRALDKAQLTNDDVTLVDVEQLKGFDALETAEIDAMITYPPFSVQLLENGKYHTLFTSREIPGEVIDTVSIRQSVLERDPQLVSKLLATWQQVSMYVQSNPDQAYATMAEREQLALEEFKVIFEQDVKVLSAAEMRDTLLNHAALEKSAASLCQLMTGLIHYKHNCDNISGVIYRGEL